jgi:hypothetical protein
VEQCDFAYHARRFCLLKRFAIGERIVGTRIRFTVEQCNSLTTHTQLVMMKSFL